MGKLEAIKEELYEMGYNAEIHTMFKNNVKKSGIVLGTLSSAPAPIIYEEFIPEGTVEEMAMDVIRMSNEAIFNNTPEVGSIDREFILNNVHACICRSDWNNDMLQELVNDKVFDTDLSVYYRTMIDDTASFKITKSIIKSIGITEQELSVAAEGNDQYSIKNINEIMAGLMGMDALELPPMPMNVLTNKSGFYGAAGILNTKMLKETMKKFGCEKLYILPSSVHEVLCIPDNLVSEQELKFIICDVNEQCVSETDRLSDHPYVFDGIAVRNCEEL